MKDKDLVQSIVYHPRCSKDLRDSVEKMKYSNDELSKILRQLNKLQPILKKKKVKPIQEEIFKYLENI